MRLPSILLLALPIRFVLATEEKADECIDSTLGAVGASGRACPEPHQAFSRCDSDDDAAAAAFRSTLLRCPSLPLEARQTVAISQNDECAKTSTSS